MLAPADVEIKVLSSLLTLADLRLMQTRGLSSDSFLLYGEVYAYVLEYVHTYQEMPRPADLVSRFKDTDSAIDFEQPGNLEYYIDELHKLELARNIRISIKQHIGDRGLDLDRNPDETMRLIVQDLGGMSHSRSQNVAMLDRDALSRLQTLQDRQTASAEGRIIGVPTGLKCFDGYQEGWQPGEAVMLIGPKGSGKSWMMMYFAIIAYQHGLKVLFFSPEMSWEECALRFDVMLARQFYDNFLTHTELKTGINADIDQYRAWLEKLTDRADFMCVDSVDDVGFTLTGMISMMDEFHPDLVVLDGIHLVKDAHGVSDWSIIKETADGLKSWAQRGKNVTIWSGQVDREGMRHAHEPVASGASAAYGKAAVESANRLITLGADSDDPYRRVFKVPNNRSGREWHEKQTLIFDVNTGLIEQQMVQEPVAFNIEDFEKEF